MQLYPSAAASAAILPPLVMQEMEFSYVRVCAVAAENGEIGKGGRLLR
jgi:hypothetical protein